MVGDVAGVQVLAAQSFDDKWWSGQLDGEEDQCQHEDGPQISEAMDKLFEMGFADEQLIDWIAHHMAHHHVLLDGLVHSDAAEVVAKITSQYIKEREHGCFVPVFHRKGKGKGGRAKGRGKKGGKGHDDKKGKGQCIGTISKSSKYITPFPKLSIAGDVEASRSAAQQQFGIWWACLVEVLQFPDGGLLFPHLNGRAQQLAQAHAELWQCACLQFAVLSCYFLILFCKQNKTSSPQPSASFCLECLHISPPCEISVIVIQFAGSAC